MEKGTRWLFISLAVFIFGIVAGCSLGVNTAPELLYNYFSSLAAGEISPRTAAALTGAAVWWLALFLSAFFRFGIVTASLTVGTKGFIDGFAVTAILRILGFRGIGMCFIDCLGAPCTVIMAAMVMWFLNGGESSVARFLLKCIIILLISLAAAALASVISGAVCKALLAGMNF